METWKKVLLVLLAIFGGFILLIVLVGGIAYFGVLSPDTMLPDRCNVNPEFSCNDFQISDSAVRLSLQNNMAEPTSINSISFSGEGIADTSCEVNEEVAPGGTFRVDCPIEFSGSADKTRIDFVFEHRRVGSSFAVQASGDMYATVQ